MSTPGAHRKVPDWVREIQVEFGKLAFEANQAGMSQEWLDRMAALATRVRTAFTGEES